MESDTSLEARPSVRPAEKKEGGLRETTRFLLLLFLFALILRSFIVAPFSIPSGSMLPTMMIGDYLRSEEHTSELQSLMRISYAVFCLKKKKTHHNSSRQKHL